MNKQNTSNFSRSWKASKNPGKQRKYRTNSPLHLKQKLLNAHISKDLRKKYSKRSIRIRKGDKVKIMAGRFSRHEGKVERIDLKKTRVYISGVETTKKDGTKKMLPVHPSNVMIMELSLDDKLRQKILERK